jgi:5-methylcytosine-specific restriction endonuclease McrA
MPIKPENKARYPADWKQIRASILVRAGDCCEQCKVPNHARIARGIGEDATTYMLDTGDVYCHFTGLHLGQCRHSDYNVGRMTDVVLTIAHLDHTPENCDPANLKALCQRCHLAYDAEHHKANAQATRRARLNNGELFA